MNINDTIDTVKVLDTKRLEYSREHNGACDAVTRILWRAARKLDAEARAYLTEGK